jgi:cell division protein FtsB
MEQNPPLVDKTHFLLRLRLVSKIALIVGGLACLSMVLVLTFITDDLGVNYETIIRSHSLSRQDLGPALLVVGLFLVAFSGVITFLISLYTGFYIAGPLFRFARNLEIFIAEGQVVPIPTRENDQLKQEEQQIKRSIAKLQNHYGALRAATDTALAQLAAQQNPSATIAYLKELERATRL